MLSMKARVHGHINRPTNPFTQIRMDEIEQSISRRFEQIAARWPEQIAVETSTETLTYHALNQTANCLARTIISRRGEGEEPVGLLASHDSKIIIAMLAVLKAGKTCVPIDPDFSAVGVRSVLEDTEARLVVTDDSYRNLLQHSADSSVSLINLSDAVSSDAAVDLDLPASPGAPAWILYTSGSTGQPKGVVHTHRTILNEIRRQTAAFHICSSDRLSFIAPINVIGGVREMLLPLLNGATLCAFDIRGESLGELSNWFNRKKITVSRFVPSVFRALVDSLGPAETVSSLRLIFVGGELVKERDLELYREYFPDECLFVHVLGSTETGIFRHHFIAKDTPLKGGDIPLGYEVDDVKTLLFDDARREVAAGQVGEIAVSSRYLPLGYWRRPDLTDERFLQDPTGGDARIYLTGDLGRFLADGSLVYLGRKDFMVKVRGYRVEPGEIEKHILDHAAIKEAVVIAAPDQNGEPHLIAYVVSREKPLPTTSDLRGFLEDRIPEYAVPSVFVFLEALPLGPNGKVDRKALPAPDHLRPELNSKYTSAQDSVQEKLVQIWESVLGIQSIGIEDNFFDLGGNSLFAVKLFSQIEKAFRLRLQLRPATLSLAPTVAQLATLLRQEQRSKSWSSLMPIQPNGSRIPFFLVHGEFSNAFLPAYLGSDQPFYGLEHQSQDGKPALHTRVETIAMHYLEEIQMVQPHGPYFLGGYSFGGTVAFEIAQQLKKQGEEVRCLIILDSGFPGLPESPNTDSNRQANHVPMRKDVSRHLSYMTSLGLKEKLTYVTERVKEKILGNTTGIRKPLRKAVCKVHIAMGSPIPRRLRSQYILDIYRCAVETYSPQPYLGPVIYIKSEKRHSSHYLHWARLIGGGMALYEVNGDHMSIRREPYVQPWAQILESCLIKAQTLPTQSVDKAAIELNQGECCRDFGERAAKVRGTLKN